VERKGYFPEVLREKAGVQHHRIQIRSLVTLSSFFFPLCSPSGLSPPLLRCKRFLTPKSPLVSQVLLSALVLQLTVLPALGHSASPPFYPLRVRACPNLLFDRVLLPYSESVPSLFLWPSATIFFHHNNPALVLPFPPPFRTRDHGVTALLLLPLRRPSETSGNSWTKRAGPSSLFCFPSLRVVGRIRFFLCNRLSPPVLRTRCRLAMFL